MFSGNISKFFRARGGLKTVKPIKWLMFAIIKRIELLNIDIVAQMYVNRVQFVNFVYIFPFICCKHCQQVKFPLVHANKPEIPIKYQISNFPTGLNDRGGHGPLWPPLPRCPCMTCLHLEITLNLVYRVN